MLETVAIYRIFLCLSPKIELKAIQKGLTMIFEASVYLQLYVSLFKTAQKAFDCLYVIENGWNSQW